MLCSFFHSSFLSPFQFLTDRDSWLCWLLSFCCAVAYGNCWRCQGGCKHILLWYQLMKMILYVNVGDSNIVSTKEISLCNLLDLPGTVIFIKWIPSRHRECRIDERWGLLQSLGKYSHKVRMDTSQRVYLQTQYFLKYPEQIASLSNGLCLSDFQDHLN